jgi:quercetin dioxygenase-like cupin family protein
MQAEMDHMRIEEAVEFSAAKRIRKKLLGSSRIVAELLCYEPGQSTPVHHHPQQDEVFYVLEGSGRIFTRSDSSDTETKVEPKSLIFVPSGTQHGLTADSRMVVLFFKSPATPGTASA